MRSVSLVCSLVALCALACAALASLDNDLQRIPVKINAHRRAYDTPRAHAPRDQTYYFDQTVDHFDPLNADTYKQKYFVFKDNWKRGGPIFFFLGGEAPLEFFDFQEVLPRMLTKDFGAMYVALEHRFYGVSMPAPDFSTNNLRLLSSRQALADAANFIVSFNKTLSSPGPWVIWGCSYSGALSAWFRAKYPNLVIGSIAPSGPVFAYNNFTQYYGQFTTAASPDCVLAVKQATSSVMTMLTTPTGRKSLQQIFNTCDPISESVQDNYYFLYSITEAVGSSDQFQNPPAFPLNQTCDTLLSSSDYLGNWAKVVQQQQQPPSAASCYDYNEMRTFVQPMQQVNDSDRAWFFQVCTEFGWFSTAYPGTSVFPPVLDLEHQLAWCEQIYGIKGMQPDLEATNEYYGGFNLLGTNILFTNGLLDPWHNMSINKDLPSPSGVKAITYDAAHCAPMTQPTAQDSPSLSNARTAVKAAIQQWLAATQ